MKLAIDIGHNCTYDHGASGIKSEDSLNFKVGSKLIEKCSSADIEVVNCLPKSAVSLYDSLNKRVNTANASMADFFISIHHNAFPGAHGTEILCIPGGKGEEVSKIILPEIVKLGFTNRGVKARYDLFVLNKTRMSAILIECAFCDSEIDMKNYDSDKMAEAIFNGICKAFRINYNKAVYHEIKQGDTLWSLSKLYNTTVDNLTELNRLSNPNIIYPEQKIRVK